MGLRKYYFGLSGSGRIPAELFQILKDDAVKVLYSICQQIWKTQQWPQDQKRSAFILIKKGNAKECSNSFHMLVKLCSKSFKLGFSSKWSKNFQIYKVGLEKAEDCQYSLDHRESKRVPGKRLLLLHDYAKDFMWITTNGGKFWKRWEYQTILPVSEKQKVRSCSVCRARSNS